METVNGQPTWLRWNSDSRSTVIYVFSPTCQWCRRNLEAVQALIKEAPPSYRFIGVSLTRDGLTEYLKKTGLRLPVYVANSTTKPLDLNVTPETIIVSPQGVVKKVWLGAYSGKTSADVESTFALKLPAVHLE